MITSVGLQYAKALFDIAQQSNQENEYYECLKAVEKIFESNDDIMKTLSHPLVNKDERKEILNTTFKEYVDYKFLCFLNVLVDNDRLSNLKDIVSSYATYLNELNQTTEATVYTRYQLDDIELNKIKNLLELKNKKHVNLNVIIDETLIGGIMIKLDGKVLDASMLNQMHDLKNELKKGW